MKRVFATVILAIALLFQAGCQPKPVTLSDQEQRLYLALLQLLDADPAITELEITGVDAGFAPTHLNIDLALDYTRDGNRTSETVRLIFQTGEIVRDPYGCYSDTVRRNDCMDIQNINRALRDHFKHPDGG